MKQIQLAVIQLSDANSGQVRAEVEGPLNNGWELESWKPVGIITRDELNNLPIVPIVVCLIRELPDEPVVAKRGRPAKVEEPEAANA